MTSPSLYGVAVLTLLVVKFALSLIPRRAGPTGDTSSLKVAAVITVFNEDPRALRACLQSLLRQTRVPDAVVVVDDCSTDPRARQVAAYHKGLFDELGVDYQVVEFARNQGKRHGLAAGFRLHPDADVYLGIDSDTVLDKLAVEEGMKPFASRRVTGVTGVVLALNARKNLLTRLIDLRYANAFMYERAAYSLLGSVLCACGSLAFYRGDVVRANLDDFLNQKFLGREATFGDDRRLTNYCLERGKVVLQPSAKAWTLVPERMRHYLKQQVRWNKSFFRESLWVMLHGATRRPPFWLTLVEVCSWVMFTVMLVGSLAWSAVGHHGIVAQYGIYVVVFSYARSIRYLGHGNTLSPRYERAGTFLLAPLYGLLNITVLLWVRIYSLCTLRRNGWGTRSGVEVTL